MKLYHGSYTTIEIIDLAKSRPFKDFGRAFYLSADEQQAWERAYAATTLLGGEASVTEYEFDEQVMTSGELKVLRFDDYSEEWADFVFANRKRQKTPFMHDYDIVYGPIANDNVGEQVVLFKGGYISKERFLRKLKNMRGITFQYAFCTDAAISKLKKL